MRSALWGQAYGPAGPGGGALTYTHFPVLSPSFPGSLLLPRLGVGRVRRVVSWCVSGVGGGGQRWPQWVVGTPEAEGGSGRLEGCPQSPATLLTPGEIQPCNGGGYGEILFQAVALT